MHERAKRPQVRKIDVRVPTLSERGAPWESPLLDDVDRAIGRRIDGECTVHALTSALGLADDVVASSLAKLERLRLVALAEPRRSSLNPSPPPVRLQAGPRPAMATLPATSEMDLDP
jgi:hypothetical protein